MTIPTLPGEFESGGVIGSRSLRAMQLLRIGRHTSSAFLIPRQGILVVAGRGPEAGSNGAGKTVVVGGMSLLNGDGQWRGSDGVGPNAARLLFDQNRARVADLRYGDAPHGYIAGVYLKPDALDSAITVWMRIERHGPEYIQVRWMRGIGLAAGDTEKNRLVSADTIWDAMRGTKTLRVGEYAETLFGQAPRCIAYIRARGSEENQDRGLLALGQRQFRPVDLANQIINLAGKREALENERKFRLELASSETQLEVKQAAYELQRERFDRELEQIGHRRKARQLLAAAGESWVIYLTIGMVLEYEAVEGIEAQLAEISRDIEAAEEAIIAKTQELKAMSSRTQFVQSLAQAAADQKTAEAEAEEASKAYWGCEQEVKRLELEQSGLRKSLADTVIPPFDTAEEALAGARARVVAESAELLRLEGLHRTKAEHLARMEAGRGGPSGLALDALADDGIDASSILDLVAPPSDERAQWEARLSAYASTIVLAVGEDATLERAKSILAQHPGIPVLTVPVSTSVEALSGDTSVLENFLSILEQRMPPVDADWVADVELGIEVRGGFGVPLTDRQAAIAVAEDEIRELNHVLRTASESKTAAEVAVVAAEGLVELAKAAVRLRDIDAGLPGVMSTLVDLRGKRDAAREALKSANEALRQAKESLETLDKRIEILANEIDDFKNGKTGTVALRLRRTDVGDQLRARRKGAVGWNEAARAGGLDAARGRLAVDAVEVSTASRDAAFQEARTRLRYAIAAVHSVESVLGPAHQGMAIPGTDELNERLNSGLTELHRWCEQHQPAAAATFESVARPLVEWLDWNGAEDHVREDQIRAEKLESEQEIEGARVQARETHEWIESLRETQIAVISQAFKVTESTLNSLLDTLGKDRVRLRPTHTDVSDTEQPLRWELKPQWLPREGKPVDYTNPPNTAELIILHVLLATAALVAATQPRGRMLILDESGNNLDGPNLSKVSAVLQQIAERHGLTVVLACQDIYTDRVSQFSAASIQLLRHSLTDALNAPPTLIFDNEEPEVVEALMPYMNIARPDGPEPEADDPR